MQESIKLARSKAKDPEQENIRQLKQDWNSKTSDFVSSLIQFKKLMNGRESEFYKQKSKITEPIPVEPSIVIQTLAQNFKDLAEQAYGIGNKQKEYSRNRQSRRKEASNKITRLLSYVKGPHFGSSPEATLNRSRKSLLSLAADVAKDFKILNSKILGRSHASLLEAKAVFNRLTKTLSAFVTFVNNLENPNKALPPAAEETKSEKEETKKVTEVTTPVETSLDEDGEEVQTEVTNNPVNNNQLKIDKNLVFFHNKTSARGSDGALLNSLKRKINKINLKDSTLIELNNKIDLILKIIEDVKNSNDNENEKINLAISFRKELSLLKIMLRNILNIMHPNTGITSRSSILDFIQLMTKLPKKGDGGEIIETIKPPTVDSTITVNQTTDKEPSDAVKVESVSDTKEIEEANNLVDQKNEELVDFFKKRVYTKFKEITNNAYNEALKQLKNKKNQEAIENLKDSKNKFAIKLNSNSIKDILNGVYNILFSLKEYPATKDFINKMLSVFTPKTIEIINNNELSLEELPKLESVLSSLNRLFPLNLLEDLIYQTIFFKNIVNKSDAKKFYIESIIEMTENIKDSLFIKEINNLIINPMNAEFGNLYKLNKNNIVNVLSGDMVLVKGTLTKDQKDNIQKKLINLLASNYIALMKAATIDFKANGIVDKNFNPFLISDLILNRIDTKNKLDINLSNDSINKTSQNKAFDWAKRKLHEISFWNKTSPLRLKISDFALKGKAATDELMDILEHYINFEVLEKYKNSIVDLFSRIKELMYSVLMNTESKSTNIENLLDTRYLGNVDLSDEDKKKLQIIYDRKRYRDMLGGSL
jgi:hypothetical protein